MTPTFATPFNQKSNYKTSYGGTRTFLMSLSSERQESYQGLLSRLIGGYLPAYIMAEQLFTWFNHSKRRDGKVYKSHVDWLDELGISKKQADTASKRLRVIGIDYVVAKANGNPTRHYYIDIKRFTRALVKAFEITADNFFAFGRRVFQFFKIDTKESYQRGAKESTQNGTKESAETAQIYNNIIKQHKPTEIIDKKHVHVLKTSSTGDVSVSFKEEQAILADMGVNPDKNAKHKNYEHALSYPLEKLQEYATYTQDAVDKGLIKNKAGFFCKALFGDWSTNKPYTRKSGDYTQKRDSVYSKSSISSLPDGYQQRTPEEYAEHLKKLAAEQKQPTPKKSVEVSQARQAYLDQIRARERHDETANARIRLKEIRVKLPNLRRKLDHWIKQVNEMRHSIDVGFRADHYKQELPYTLLQRDGYASKVAQFEAEYDTLTLKINRLQAEDEAYQTKLKDESKS